MEKKPSLLKRLFSFAGNHKYLTVIGMILSGISAVLMLMPIICIYFMIKEIFAVLPNISAATGVAIWGWRAVIFAVSGILVYFLALMCTHISAFRIARNIRYQCMKHIFSLPLGYFTSQRSGKLRRIIDDSSGQTESYLAHQLPDLVGAFVTPAAAVVILFIFDWRLGLISLAPILISFIFLMMMMGPSLASSMQEYQTALEDMNAEAVEYVRGMSVVKAFGQSVFSFKRFHDSIMRYRDWAVKYALKLRIPNTCYTISLNAISVFLAVGGVLLIGTVVNFDAFMLDLIFYILFTPICITMMNKIMWTSENTMLAKDAIRRIDSILEEDPLAEPASPQQPESSDIIFEQVSFTYPGGTVPALNEVSLHIAEGQTVALVGSSGGGKTTLASLIPRFFDASSGSVKIGGVNVRDISSEKLMQQTSFVFQNSSLFKSSLLDNIKMGKPDATEEEVFEAVKAAQCEDIIEKFPNGLNTVVGTKGVYLSGGEAQRIALARAILKDAPIILLDEATAFADPENEYRIQKAFERLTKGKTVVMIAHRLSTVKHADNIVVLEAGRIVEQGTHDSLLEMDGRYAAMWDEYLQSVTWKVGREEAIHG